MNTALVQNWNSVVHHDDEVYHLGDVSFGNEQETNSVLSRLYGHKHLVLGNHDYPKMMNMFKRHFETIDNYKVLNYDKWYFVLFHYPIAEWHWQHRGAIHLHGHIHSTRQDNDRQRYRRYDVGVRANDYFPVSIETVIKIAEGKEILGHHRDQ